MSVKITGLNSLKVELKGVLDEVIDQIGDELIWAAEEIEGRAKQYANEHKDRGLLMNSIKSDITNPLETSVSVAAFYAPYVEFGTKKRFEGNGREEYAAQFRGKGQGDYFDFLNNILDWVIRKNIGGTYSVKTRKVTSSKSSRENQLEAAQAIANSIIRHGIKARPFLFRAYDEVRPELINNLENILQ